jgi:phosphoribosylformimino-5-aminoimidazole carboxamide ribotide isomerase
MEIWPAIDIRGGKVVQLVGGDPNETAVVETRTPQEQARYFRDRGARRLHVVDLDGALGGVRQWPHVSRIRGEGLPVQFGGGVRSMLDVQKLLDLGVDRVIVGTQGVRNPDWLREVATLWPHRVVLAVDARGRDVVVAGWTERTGKDVAELVASLDDARLAGFLYTNVDKEGRLDGVDEDAIRAVRTAAARTPLIISGGITDVQDLERLATFGVDAVVLGMSVYTRRIDLGAAVERFEGREVTT